MIAEEWHKSATLREAMTHAVHGVVAAWRQERNFKIQAVICITVFGLGWLLGLSAVALALIVTLSVIIFGLELLNTALEILCDTVNVSFSRELRYVKDVAAAAVLVASVGAVVVGFLLFIPAVL